MIDWQVKGQIPGDIIVQRGGLLSFVLKILFSTDLYISYSYITCILAHKVINLPINISGINIMGWCGTSTFFFFLLEPKPESQNVASKVLRSVLHPIRWHHCPGGGDEQRAATGHEDALQVRPERLLLQEASVTQRASQVLPHLQRPGLPGDARGFAL